MSAGDTPKWHRYLRFWRSNVGADVDDELAFHVDARAQELREAGMEAAAARARAVAEFGDVERTRLRLAWSGVVVGTVVSFAVTGVLASILYGVKPHDPVVLASVAGLLTAIAILACFAPARRATRIDPITALRAE
jgi:putative ABC transport system permease protein